jgi:hypothetical protein
MVAADGSVTSPGELKGLEEFDSCSVIPWTM